MNRPTEYCAYKKILFERKGVHGNEKIALLNESLDNAYADMDIDDLKVIRRNKYKLMEKLDGIGRNGALEIQAAIGNYLNGLEI